MKPFFVSQVGKIQIDTNMQTQNLKTYNDGVYDYILCDGTLAYKLEDYPLLKGKIDTYTNEAGDVLFNAPNTLDRTIRQVNNTEPLLVLQTGEIKKHNHTIPDIRGRFAGIDNALS
ncbi:MAG: hypothetical protein FWE18_00840 [Alphaproteobacteria bacterium]|nr:hypothetical protein [Alphaproteobacteria bacterium]